MTREREILDGQTWQRLADGNQICPLCGSTVHPAYQQAHRLWHLTLVAVSDELLQPAQVTNMTETREGNGD